jgi:competence protein ComEA
MTARDLLIGLLMFATVPLGVGALRPPVPLIDTTGEAPPRIDLNQASLDELLALDGIGPQLARAIAASRPFTSVEDLVKVPGIGPKRLAALRPYVQTK